MRTRDDMRAIIRYNNQQAALRELEEETGYVAGEFIELSQVLILPAYSDEKIHVYLARDLILTQQNLDKDEIIAVATTPANTLLDRRARASAVFLYLSGMI